MGKKRINILDLSKEKDTDEKAVGARSPRPSTVGANQRVLPAGRQVGPKKKKKLPVRAGLVSARDKKETGVGADLVSARKKRPPKLRSKRYQSLKKSIKTDKTYSSKKAIRLIVKSANTRFDESVDVDIIVKKEKLSGAVKLPHGTGKKKKIAIFDKKTEEKIKKGKLDFDLLIAKPANMKKVAKYGKILGPKGLMPNPKNKTISEDPEKAIKELSDGKISFKTEKKAPLIHMAIGKVSFGEKKLLENLEALLKAVNPKLIKKAVLSSTMGPGVKLKIV